MARYRKIDSRIWNDKKFRELSDNAKLVFFMLLTHPHMTSLGAMRASCEGLAAEMKWQPKAFREAFGEALSKGMAKYDSEASFVWLPRFLRYNGPESPNVVKAWAGALDLLPECDLKLQVIQSVKAFAEGLTEGFQKALPEAFAKSMPYPEPEPEQEQELEAPVANATAGRELESEILAAYHDALPDLPKVRDWNDRRRKKLQARIRERVKAGKPADTVDYWRSVFGKAAASDFLTGRKTDWRCPGLEWLLESTNFTKLIEGAYDNHGRG